MHANFIQEFIQAWRIYDGELTLFTAYQIIGKQRTPGRRAAEIGGNYRDLDIEPLDKTERIKLTQ